MVLRMLLRAVVIASLAHGLLAQEPVAEPAEVVGFETFDHAAGALELGARPPIPKWGPWRRGEPIDFDAAEAPACTLVAVYPWPSSVSAQKLAADADYLAHLQRRFADRGLRVVLAISDADLPIAPVLDGCSVVVDAGQQAATEWGIVFSAANIVAIAKGGITVFQGGLEGDVVDAVQHALDGSFTASQARALSIGRRMLAGNFEFFAETPEAAQISDRLLADAPHDGLLWGLACIAAAADPRAGAGSGLRAKGLAALGGESRPLAVFADLVLRWAPRSAALGDEFVAPLQQAAASAPQDPFVQLAYLRALMLANKGREMGRQVARIRKLVQGSFVDSRLAFAEILLQDATPAVHRDVVQQILSDPAVAKYDSAPWEATRYLLELRCAEDKQGAQAVLDRFLEQQSSLVSVNNACWYLMTDLPTMGRYPGFVTALAEHLLGQRDTLDDFMFDTVALAMFQAGRCAEAVELQGVAIQKSGGGNPLYAARQKRYEAAATAAPR